MPDGTAQALPNLATIVLIGPAGSGKSTVGAVLATRLDREFIDLDAVGDSYYRECGQSLSDLGARIAANGYVAAHRWWQRARLHAAAAVLRDHPGAVIAFGAGHSHYEDEDVGAELACLLSGVTVVLLTAPVPTLRRRCLVEKGHDWKRDGVDFLALWESSAQNRRLATLTLSTENRTVDQVADLIGTEISS